MPNRIKAFFIHFCISCLIITSVGLGFIHYFYPGVFATLEGVYSAFITLAIVDITLGPLLTFLIYKPGKKGLAFDLAAIAYLQTVALGYGLFVLYDQRPGFLVFYFDSFYSFPANIDQTALPYPELKVGPLSPPKVIAADLTGSTKEKFTKVQESIQQHRPIQGQSRFFMPLQDYFSTHKKRLIKQSNGFKNKFSLTSGPYYVFEALAGGSSHLIKLDENTLRPLAVITINH